MKELVETYRGVIYPWQCDHMGHMNVMWYVGKFDEATWNLFAVAGVTAGFQIPMSYVAERFTTRTMLTISAAVGGVAYLFAGASAGFVSLLLMLFIGGIGSSIQHPVASALVLSR